MCFYYYDFIITMYHCLLLFFTSLSFLFEWSSYAEVVFVEKHFDCDDIVEVLLAVVRQVVIKFVSLVGSRYDWNCNSSHTCELRFRKFIVALPYFTDDKRWRLERLVHFYSMTWPCYRVCLPATTLLLLRRWLLRSFWRRPIDWSFKYRNV